MTLVNPALSPIILAPVGSKDSRWLTLEVCREFARSKCSRADEECKYAHPPPHVEIQNGRVTCCFDSIKGKCQRKDPPCKYLHPPQHLKELLLQNGRQNLIVKSLQMQTAALQPNAAVVQLPSVYPVIYEPVKPVVQASPAAPPYSAHHLSSLHPSYSSMAVPTAQYLGLMSPRGTANHSYLMPAPMSYAYYKPPSVGSIPRIIPTFERGATFPLSIETNHLVGSLSGASVASGHNNGLAHHLVDSTSSVNKQLERQMMEVMTTMGRKRPHEAAASVAMADDLFLGVNAMPGVVPVLKRPALVNPQGGLPIYRPCTAIYHSAAPLTTLQLQQPTQFVSLTK